MLRYTQLCRPFIDLDSSTYAERLNLYSDVSLSRKHGGLGAVFLNKWWISEKWETELLDQDPSIEYLELFALFAALRTWGSHPKLCNTRVEIYCDNSTVENWINNMMGDCSQSMKLIRMFALDCIKYNRRVFVVHVDSASNKLADALLRLNYRKFWRHALSTMNTIQDQLPADIWPATKL